MQRALSLARKGLGRVSPNPCVGAVLVKGQKIISEGFHPYCGGPHGEIVALRKAGKKAKGASLYINLEPCTHWGKTPPCAPEVIKAGIKKAYISMRDPNPEVTGRGIAALKKGGVGVSVGLEEDAARLLNRPYLTWRNKKRPYVILKLAMTLDGKIATEEGTSRWITGLSARTMVHKLRSKVDGILVGRNTVAKDNPTLSSHGAGKNPIPIILDPEFKSSLSAKVLKGNSRNALVVVGPNAPLSKVVAAQKKGHKILRESLKNGKFNMRNVVSNLLKNNIYQLLVEGGSETAWSFIHENLVDEVYLFLAPKLLGGRKALGPIGGQGFNLKSALPVQHMSIRKVGSDVLLHGYLG